MSRLFIISFVEEFTRFLFIFSSFSPHLPLSGFIFFFSSFVSHGKSSRILPSATEYHQLEITSGLTSLEGVEFPSPGSSISSPTSGKIGVYLKTLDAGIRFHLTDFQEEVFQKDGCSLQMLTPNAVNKVVLFEMICRANGYLPYYFVFKFFFRFSVTGNKCTFSVRRGGHAPVPDGRTPKNWQDKWLWVKHELVGSGRYRANAFADTIPKLFPHNQGVADYLKSVQAFYFAYVVFYTLSVDTGCS
ncbi:unnamed protein product [Lactuca saligna]|uniref:Uncharacterized protein n=1 Tax=Lactuca saligna TaxID=75948 RepID=A0AA35Z6T9_LACSI|nr:unnamed protein product [Lactuca saligna]